MSEAGKYAPHIFGEKFEDNYAPLPPKPPQEYEIVDIDLWEKDAIIIINGKRVYFQFDEAPTVEEAMKFFEREHYGIRNNDSTGISSSD